jgi:hypothetical protein
MVCVCVCVCVWSDKCARCRFTVIPCTAVAGLEVQSPGGEGWTYPEVQGRAGVDVAVLVGETLHDLAPIFPMAVHRVMTPRLFFLWSFLFFNAYPIYT